MQNGSLRIGEAAQRLGINARTIRFYESVGLLPPPKRTEHGYASSGHRLFTAEDLQRLRFIRQARLLDLSLDQIRELVEVTEEGCCGSARPHLKTLVQGKLPELRRRIAELRRLERHLEVLQRMLLDEASKVDRSCDGTVVQCVPMGSQPPLEISPPRVRHDQRSKR